MLNPGPLGTTCAVTLPGVGPVGKLELGLELGLERFVCLAEPVGGENHVEGGHDGAAQPGHQLHPFTPHLPVLGVVVGRLDEVLRPGERHFAVNHHDLAVVPEVRPAPLAVDGQQREHPPPLDPAGFEALEEPVVALDPEGADVVEQHADFHAAVGGVFQRREQLVRHVVRAHDVELGVDEPLGFPDVLGHGPDGVRVARDELHGVAVHHRDRTQPAVEFGGGFDPFGAGIVASDVGQQRRAGPHPFADQLLLLHAPPGQPEVAEQQEKDQADGGHKEDAQQPRHGGGGPAVAGDDAQGEHPDDEVGGAENENQPGGQGSGERKWPQHW